MRLPEEYCLCALTVILYQLLSVVHGGAVHSKTPHLIIAEGHSTLLKAANSHVHGSERFQTLQHMHHMLCCTDLMHVVTGTGVYNKNAALIAA